MKEVSSKAFELFFKPLAAKGIDAARMLEGTGVEMATLQNKNERVGWAEFCAIMKNVRPCFTDEEYVHIGRSFFQSPGLRFAFVVARLLLTPMGFYRWQNKPRNGAGNQLFTCIVPHHRDLSDTECEVDLTLPDGFEVCWDFYIVTIGTFSEMPRLLGYPEAQVRLERLPNGGRYHITVPSRTPFLTRIRRALSWPFTVRAAARELRAAHETLVDRFEQLEDARAKLDRQATQLRTAHTVNQLAQRDLDLDKTLDTVARALVQEAGFTRAEIQLIDGDRLASFGVAEHEVRLSRSIEARGGHVIGDVTVAPRRGADRAELEALLEFILPSLSIALENAIYRTGLERLVDLRTVELRQASDQLARTVDQLREAQGARERFFGNISHEIRTPLSIIMLAADDVKARGGGLLDTRARAGLGVVTDSARKLVRLVDELLLLAAGQEGKLRTSPEPSDLTELVQHLVAAWLPAADVAGLELVTRVQPSVIANIDPVAIERVATNLVSNAIKYTPRGGRVELELAESTDGIRLSVFDTGPGFDGDLAGRLFGRFERAESERRNTGTGLGLSLVKQLVEAHGGTITAVPRPRGGSELRVVLPASLIIHDDAVSVPAAKLRLVDESPAAPAPSKADVHLAPRGVSRGTILLAEDDARLAEMIARLLSDEYTVLVAHDGLAALEMVQKQQPQLLITDVDMPGMNGIELSRRFRELSSDRLAPIIILSAIFDLKTRVAGLDAGAVDYVTKPFDPFELRARVRAQFRMRDLAIRLHRAEQLSSLGLLTSGLAHELRNPANGIVNAIMPLTELLPPELTHADHPVGQLLEVIGGCSDQIAFLSRQLLGFRSGTLQLEKQRVRLRDLVQRALSLAQRSLAEVEVRSDVELEDTISCAPPLMTQVLTNLLENAGHAAGRGGWVDIRGRIQDGQVTVEIADSGLGVPLDLRDRVFEPFFTTKEPGVGTGLGLSLSRDIIHRHGGVLEIRDRGPRGIFVIELPHHSALDAAVSAV